MCLADAGSWKTVRPTERAFYPLLTISGDGYTSQFSHLPIAFLYLILIFCCVPPASTMSQVYDVGVGGTVGPSSVSRNVNEAAIIGIKWD